jgi:hypothetical protein
MQERVTDPVYVRAAYYPECLKEYYVLPTLDISQTP